MTGLMKIAALLSLAPTILAVPRPAQALLPLPVATDTNACGIVADQQTRQLAANPGALVTVSAAQAAACLQSVPNKKDQAVKLIESLKAYLSWQSTLSYLKDPPASYMLPAVDIMGGLDAISANVSAGTYASEYDFQSSIVLLIAQAHDGHFGYRPDVYKAFSFRNDLTADMVSVSVDGKQVPKLYNFAVLNGTTTMVANITMPLDENGFPPAITKINGQDAAAFMEQQGLMFINSQDPDSQWNAQFLSYINLDGRPTISASIFYQGDVVTLEYENGQTITQESYAAIRATANFTGVTNGEDFYNHFCNPDAADNSSTTTTSTPTSATSSPTPTATPADLPPIPGFPTPEIRDSGADVTAGYFLSGQGYEDVAVLSVLGFAPANDFDTTEYVINFQKIVGDFLAKCKTAGKTRLIVDVSGNGGGLVVAGYELYSQIFPSTLLFQANNMRRTDSMVQLSKIANDNLDKLLNVNISAIGTNSSDQDIALATLADSSVISNLIPGGVYSAGNAVNYTSGTQIISPVSIHGDTFTAYQSTPLNQTASDFNLTGTGSRSNPPAAVFDASNVTILTDGSCGSTCTLFTYLMIMQNNIKAVSVGGRPLTGPMQSVGGVEGAQVFELENLQSIAAAALVLATPEQRASMNKSELGIIAEGYVLQRAAIKGGAGAINGKNAFSHSDAKTPLQFLYEPANCRFFYTKDMIYGPEVTWKRAADAAFNDPDKFCVEGSQMPLMGVQDPSTDFFTPTAEGKGPGTVTTSGAVVGYPQASWSMFLFTALVSVALMYKN